MLGHQSRTTRFGPLYDSGEHIYGREVCAQLNQIERGAKARLTPNCPLVREDKDSRRTQLDLTANRFRGRARADRRLDEFQQHLGYRTGLQVKTTRLRFQGGEDAVASITRVCGGQVMLDSPICWRQGEHRKRCSLRSTTDAIDGGQPKVMRNECHARRVDGVDPSTRYFSRD
jgi:hypothetical protein